MRRPLLALPVLLALAACGAGTVPAEEVTGRAEEALGEQVGDDLRLDVACPGDLPAEVGAEMSCTLTAGDDPEEHEVTVRVTAVEDGKARFDIEVADQPSG